jgi:hypothetical protein
VRVFMDIVTVFAISHHDEPKNPKVDAIKNNRLIPNYLQTCSSTFCIYIVETISIFLFHFCIFFSEE